MTEEEKWDALHQTALSDHEPYCNYGQSNGREMCNCQVLVDLVEGTEDVSEPEPTFKERMEAAYEGPVRRTRSEQRERRLAAARARRRADLASRAGR